MVFLGYVVDTNGLINQVLIESKMRLESLIILARLRLKGANPDLHHGTQEYYSINNDATVVGGFINLT